MVIIGWIITIFMILLVLGLLCGNPPAAAPMPAAWQRLGRHKPSPTYEERIAAEQLAARQARISKRWLWAIMIAGVIAWTKLALTSA